MDLEKLTDRARGFLQAAQTIAVREHHQQIRPAHYLKALLDDEQGMAARLIEEAGGDGKIARREADALVTKIPTVTGSGATSAPGIDGDLIRLLDQAQAISTKAGDQYVTVERILLAIALAAVAGARGHRGHVDDDAALFLGALGRPADAAPRFASTARRAQAAGSEGLTVSAWSIDCTGPAGNPAASSRSHSGSASCWLNTAASSARSRVSAAASFWATCTVSDTDWRSLSVAFSSSWAAIAALLTSFGAPA